MRKRRVWHCYCDFCKKVTHTERSMTKHMLGCTANPNRVCGMCRVAHQAQTPLPALLEAVTLGLTSLEIAANHCPACILATRKAIFALEGEAYEQYQPYRAPQLAHDDWYRITDDEDGCRPRTLHLELSMLHEWKWPKAAAAFWAARPRRYPDEDYY